MRFITLYDVWLDAEIWYDMTQFEYGDLIMISTTRNSEKKHWVSKENLNFTPPGKIFKKK